MSGHGPDAATFERAAAADTGKPQHVKDTMAFMFESRMVIKPSRYALEGRPPLQQDYLSCWQGLKRHFDPGRA
jgi:homogentisate 1,2-dioxygenase